MLVPLLAMMIGWSHSILSDTALTRTWVRIPLEVVGVGPATGWSLIQVIEQQSVYTIGKHSKRETSDRRGLLASLNAVVSWLVKGIRNIARLIIAKFGGGSDEYHRKFRFERFVFMLVVSLRRCPHYDAEVQPFKHLSVFGGRDLEWEVGVAVCKCPFYLVSEHDTLIANSACISRGIPWQLPW
jgi:hypothetical protein